MLLALRRFVPATALAAALAVLACPVPGRAQSPATHGPVLRAVVALAEADAALPGVHVVARLPHVAAAVVEADAAALGALRRVGAVLGIAPDAPMRTQSDDDAAPAGPVLAPAAVGGDAGRFSSGAGVTVALIDTGVSDTPALNRASHRLVDGVDTSALAAGGAARTSGRFTDGYGHGTYMASVIAGGPVPGSHGRGVGVAPGARVVVVKVADSTGTTSLSQVLAGLDWVATQAPRIQVAAVALAQAHPGEGYGADPLTVAVEHVQRAGVAVVAAAGNTAGQLGDPGLDPQVLTVGAADTTRDEPTVAPFSGSGVVAGVSKPDLVAPGVSVLGLVPRGSVVAREHPTARVGRLFRGTGTSPATAVVAGAAAQFLGHHPEASVAEVKPSLRAAASSLDAAGAGQGLVQPAEEVVPSTPETTGEAGFDPDAFAASAWRGGDWRPLLDASWSPLASSWSASSWSASSWSASSWSASSWSASSWSASSWSASSWSASSWSASSWSASSWSASSWSASSWSASSWSTFWDAS